MNYDEVFEALDEFSKPKETSQGCCDDQMNFLRGDGVILCKVCHNTVTNLIDTPEWRNYGSGGGGSIDGGRCGLPVSILLPKS